MKLILGDFPDIRAVFGNERALAMHEVILELPDILVAVTAQ